VQALDEARCLSGAVGRKLNGAAQIGGVDLPGQRLALWCPGFGICVG
jgi:hypothetical protein